MATDDGRVSLRGLIAKWRERAIGLLAGPHEVSELWSKGAGSGANRCADELAATLDGMTCATCKYAGAGDSRRRTIYRGSERQQWEGIRHCNLLSKDTIVPLTINGQPFGCLAHHPAPPRADETGE